MFLIIFFTRNVLILQSKQFQFVDKRQYKGAAPSCHDVNQYTASPESVKVAVGFLAGQVQIIDVRKKESLQIMNEVVSFFHAIFTRLLDQLKLSKIV